MSADWNPALYGRFENERTLAARDLLGGVPSSKLEHIIDLGCGPGNSTELLRQRFPKAIVSGTDSSPAMLARARQRLPQCQFELSDIATWLPEKAPDLLFANAVLHWLPNHPSLFRRLFQSLSPGGVLAVQMPDNLAEPTHRSMLELASEEPWAHALRQASSSRAALLDAGAYYDLLAPEAERVHVWRTVYHHALSSTAEIVDWVRGSGLRPFLDPLSEELQREYLTRYAQRIDRHYQPRSDGKRLLAFPRLFIVAQRLSGP